MKENGEISYWIDISRYDLKTAESMLREKRFLYVGFMCHQAIEKILKACYLGKRGETPPYTHNLRYLAKECGIYDGLSEDFKATIDELEPLNIEARYPSYKAKLLKIFSPAKCMSIIAATKELYKCLKEKSLKK